MISDKLKGHQDGNVLEGIRRETPGFITNHRGERFLELSNDT